MEGYLFAGTLPFLLYKNSRSLVGSLRTACPLKNPKESNLFHRKKSVKKRSFLLNLS